MKVYKHFFLSCQYWTFHLPPVFMSQNAKTITLAFRPDNQYFPLTASPSLAFISLHDMAASSGVEPRGTGNIKMIGHVVKRSLAKFPEKKIISFEMSHVFMQSTPMPGPSKANNKSLIYSSKFSLTSPLVKEKLSTVHTSKFSLTSFPW